ncbi:ADP-ribosylglycohydrolase family protein [Prauserella flavalba]|uniref:ADP-ribosylglycohydrolase family protein n=1 Tax=Prauserella flavalba TaxID=1477506 RepID=UPI0036E827A0
MSERPVPDYARQVYAGVLGKIIGVYFGRPVEGWSYPAIRERFGELEYFACGELGVPLVVPDDDISGAFVFPRAILDNAGRGVTAADVGRTWLNYIVENRTVLWWGGLARSTEHTAFLRLKDGVDPPRSGSIALNGRSMAEGVGAQIFIDGWALACPGDPERAVALARAAGSVSHDGFAVESAAFLAGMEAAAFGERDLAKLLELGLSSVTDDRVRALVTATVEQCEATGDWRRVRDWIEREHGYHRYPGNSPAATNLAAVLMALLMAGDDFQRSLTLVVSAGWDTDSNAGNVGCLNGIRLGLDGIEAGVDLRGPVADRMLVVSADGGECVTDAVRETRRLLASAAALRGEPAPRDLPRYAFELPGSTQGWLPHHDARHAQALTGLRNPGGGLRLEFARLARGARAAAAVEVFASPVPTGAAGTSLFEVVGSPALYPGQTVRAVVDVPAGPAPSLAFFVEHYGDDGVVHTLRGALRPLHAGENTLVWDVPATGGQAVYRFGVELTSARRLDGHVTVRSVDWRGAPKDFVLGRADELSPALTPWTTVTGWLKTFVSSAANLAPDYTTTFTVSHPEANGVVTTGTRDWTDYSVASTITFNMHDAAGLVARARGHRRYYAAVLRAGRAQLLRRVDGTEHIVADAPFAYEIDAVHALEFTVRGSALTLRIDGEAVATGTDDMLPSGGAGFLIDRGSVLAQGFHVRRA